MMVKVYGRHLVVFFTFFAVFPSRITINSTNLHGSFFGQDETNRLKAFPHWNKGKKGQKTFYKSCNFFAINKVIDIFIDFFQELGDKFNLG